MRINFELTYNDYIKCELCMVSKKKSFKFQKYLFNYILPIIFIMIGFYLNKQGNPNNNGMLLLIGGFIWFFFYPFFY